MAAFKQPRALLALLICASTPALSFYLPGVAPANYKWGDDVALHVNHLTPSLTEADPQVRSVFAYDYYLPSFHFCQPEGGPQSISESLGSILFGDRIQTSPFELKMGQNETCKHNCHREVYHPEDAVFVNSLIKEHFNMNWLVDGLPAGHPELLDDDTEIISPGFALGAMQNGVQPVLNNHHDIIIEYHQASKDTFRVVGVLVKPLSRGEIKLVGDKAQCDEVRTPAVLSENKDTEVLFTYSVYWQPSSTSFATRWDKYLSVESPNIHWFFLVMAACVVIVLVLMVSTVLLRLLRKDIARYNRLDSLALDDFGGTSLVDDVQEDSGWKLVHGDVFRPPRHALLLSVLIGNGAQLFLMSGFTLAFALLGFLSPSNRGSLSTVMILLYTIFSCASGYTSSRAYAFLTTATAAQRQWKPLFALTPTILPALLFASFFLLNLFVWIRGAAGAVPFTTMLVLVGIWFLLSLPLSALGSWLGFKQTAPTPPTKTNQIPRQIPPSAATYMRPIPSALLVAVLPFAAIWVELYFVLNSIWLGRFYYMFGFLFLCFGLMIVTSACVTVLVTYFVLCSEDYRWQWRAFYTSGMSAVYVFLYALWWAARASSWESWTGSIVFVGYSAVVAGVWFVLTGTIGFIAAWTFVHRIYGSLKVD